jgi:GTP cyclohydrolase IB
MKDVQKQHDDRGLPIQKVGVKDLRYPINVLDRTNTLQSTVAFVSMYVDLPHNVKGTHMSRFVEILNNYRGEITLRNVNGILSKMIDVLGSQSAHIELKFPYFIEKQAPVSGATGLMDYDCKFIASLQRGSRVLDAILRVDVPVKTLCPCSKEISVKGAHNQRSVVSIKIRCREFVWIEELVEIAESQASSALYSVLKREDEKFVTEQAYDNPVFVEDIVRGVALRLRSDPRITWFSVESENYESIHNHSAYAAIELG